MVQQQMGDVVFTEARKPQFNGSLRSTDGRKRRDFYYSEQTLRDTQAWAIRSHKWWPVGRGTAPPRRSLSTYLANLAPCKVDNAPISLITYLAATLATVYCVFHCGPYTGTQPVVTSRRFST